jgi:hypothetical protein
MSGVGKMRDGPESDSRWHGKAREGHDLFRQNQVFREIIDYGQPPRELIKIS